MTSKSGIRPPRPPKRESPAVTIAMQQRQIEMLVDRMEVMRKRELELTTERNNANDRTREKEAEVGIAYQRLQASDDKLVRMELAMERMLGWQDCAREVIADQIGEKPNAFTR